MAASAQEIKNSYAISLYGNDFLECIYLRGFPDTHSYVLRAAAVKEDIERILATTPSTTLNCLLDVSTLEKVHLFPQSSRLYLDLVKNPRIARVAIVGRTVAAKVAVNFLFWGVKKLKFFTDRRLAEDWLGVRPATLWSGK